MFIDQREYKEEWYDGSFSLETINDEFFKKVIAVYYSASSGLGGPGVLRLLTDENIQYEIGMDMLEGDPFFCKYEGTRDYRIHLQKKWEEYEAERERLRIRPEDVEWKPRYGNNCKARFDGIESFCLEDKKNEIQWKADNSKHYQYIDEYYLKDFDFRWDAKFGKPRTREFTWEEFSEWMTEIMEWDYESEEWQ